MQVAAVRAKKIGSGTPGRGPVEIVFERMIPSDEDIEAHRIELEDLHIAVADSRRLASHHSIEISEQSQFTPRLPAPSSSVRSWVAETPSGLRSRRAQKRRAGTAQQARRPSSSRLRFRPVPATGNRETAGGALALQLSLIHI